MVDDARATVAPSDLGLLDSLVAPLARGDLDAAEALVGPALCVALLDATCAVPDALVGPSADELEAHPGLLVLVAALRERAGDTADSARTHFVRAAALLEDSVPADPLDELRLTGRLLVATVGFGDRAAGRRGLARVVELIPQVTAVSDGELAAELAVELTLPLWAAGQVDEHGTALRLARLVREHAGAVRPAGLSAVVAGAARAYEGFCGV
ncbi:MAG: hypothetical protein GX593_07260, partial [Actinomycetales bacterium]|nr:hypothetical protein [Actinomycetales bacterium]